METLTSTDKIYGYHFWRHRIPLGGGLYTPGTRRSEEWEHCKLPADLTGKTFLDIGANDGMYSFMAEQKGAKSVLATDIYSSHESEWEMQDGWSKRGIYAAREYLNSKVEVKSLSVYDLPELNRKFDYVYCANVLAWLRDPLLALEILADATNEVLHLREDFSTASSAPVFELVKKYNSDRPSCVFNGNRELFETVLKAKGFKHFEIYPVDEKRLWSESLTIFPRVSVRQGTPIYRLPSDNDALRNNEKNFDGAINFELNGKVLVGGLGWINREDVELKSGSFEESAQRKMLNHAKTSIKRVLGLSPTKQTNLNYVIIARR